MTWCGYSPILAVRANYVYYMNLSASFSIKSVFKILDGNPKRNDGLYLPKDGLLLSNLVGLTYILLVAAGKFVFCI